MFVVADDLVIKIVEFESGVIYYSHLHFLLVPLISLVLFVVLHTDLYVCFFEVVSELVLNR